METLAIGNGDQLSDIDGGQLANTHQSIFAHIRHGLLQKSHEAAVICMHQPVDHFSGWVGIEEKSRLTGSDTDGQMRCLTLTYSQLHHGAMNLVAGLLDSGVRPGMTILCMIPNGAEYALMLWACALLRLTIAAVDPLILGEGAMELQGYLQSLRPEIVVVADFGACQTVDSILAEGSGLQQPQLRLSIQRSGDPPSSDWKHLRNIVCADHSTSDVALPVEDALLQAALENDPHRIHSILFTSGTSAGRPKGCPLRVGSMTHILKSQEWLITPANSTRVLQQAHNSRAIAPQHMLATWRTGGAVVMPTDGPSFAIEHTVDAIVHFGVTFLVLSPAMVHALKGQMGKLDADARLSVQTVQVGGDSVTREVLELCSAVFPRAAVCVNHGMSEGGGIFVWPLFGWHYEKIPYFAGICPVGTVAPGARIRIWNSKKASIVPRGQPGELHVCCESMIRGYLDAVDASAFYEDSRGLRWMNTGDIAMIAGIDLVYILGRAKDAIERNEIVIMPAILESCIERCTGQQETWNLTRDQTCIVTVPDGSFGDKPCAVLRNLEANTESGVQSHVRELLGNEYALEGVVSLQQIGLERFPVNATHKIMKLEVQKAVLEFRSREISQVDLDEADLGGRATMP